MRVIGDRHPGTGGGLGDLVTTNGWSTEPALCDTQGSRAAIQSSNMYR